MNLKKLVSKKDTLLSLSKKEKFVVTVTILSTGLFLTESVLGKSAFYITFFLAILTDVLLFWSIRKDILENFTFNIFILPFFYSLSSGLFYFLAPARLLTRIVMTTVYAIGLYALLRSQNIFAIASIRTIALLAAARIVSFVVTILSYFFLVNIVFSLHLPIVFTALIIFVFSFFLSNQSFWTITLQRSVKTHMLYALSVSLCLAEIAVFLWFWPTNPTIIAIFLSGFFYTTVGLSQVWLDRRLFRGVMWEYLWVATIVFCGLMLFTSWGG